MTREVETIERVDGRRRRSEQSRQQIVRAMLELIGAGDVSPGAEAVAATAGVGLRTVFRHFDNMEALYQELNAAMAAELQPIFEAPFESEDWKLRIAELVGRRIRIFERITPFKISADIHRHHSPFLAGQAEVLVKQQRVSLADILPRHVKSDETLFASLELLLSFETWRRLRKEQRLTVPKAKAALERMLDGLIRGVA